jgi:hypothetical protein
MTKNEALCMALEALAVRFSEGWHEGIKIDASDIMLLNDAAQALAQPEKDIPKIGCVNHDCDKCKAQPEQEPVGEIGWAANIPNTIREVNWTELCPPVGTKLYTTPPQRKPLTDEQILDLNFDGEFCLITDDDEVILDFARAIEAAHGITASEAEDSQQRSKT